ncbi:MAG: BamA/TamA family outer membrane protein [bacterium]|nr:MAG: BamA/TamA family outer membrane protein [bacterium]
MFDITCGVLQKPLLLIIVLMCFSWSILHSQDEYRISSLSFSGNEQFSEHALREQMNLRSTSFVKRNILRKDPVMFSDQLLQGDLQRLLEFYQVEGFLKIRIPEPVIHINHKEKSIDILIQIDEGMPVTVRNVTTSFVNKDGYISDIEELIENLKQNLILSSGARFRDDDLARDRLNILRVFAFNGYPYIDVNFKLRVLEKESQVDIEWILRPGPLSTFGEVTLLGNERVSNEFILRQVEFKKGQIFSQKILDDTQRKLFSLGLFEVVVLKAQFEGKIRETIPVIITVKEAPQWTAKLGGGYGKEDQFRAFVQGRRIGFLGGARRLELMLKHSGLEPYNIDLKFIEPLFFSHRTALTLNPFLKRETEPGYTVARSGARISLLYQISLHLKGSFTFIRENVSQDSSTNISDQIPGITDNDLYDKAGPLIAFTWDNSSPLFSPDRGFFILVSSKINGYLLNADYPFVRYLLDARHYRRQLGFIVAYRLKLGMINSYEDQGFIPVEERFYAGGSTSVRGWARQELGPKDLNEKPIGGNSLIEGSIEFRFPVWSRFSGVVFCDFGNVWVETGYYPLNDLRYALGVGFGIDTPIGPLRLDAGRPIWDIKKSWEIHLSIGQTF